MLQEIPRGSISDSVTNEKVTGVGSSCFPLLVCLFPDMVTKFGLFATTASSLNAVIFSPKALA